MCKLLNEKSLLFAALLLSAISMSCSKDPQDTNSKQSGNNVHEWEDSTLSGDAVMGSAMAFKVGGGMSVERTAQTRATTDINGNATFAEGDLVAVAVTRSGGSEVTKLYRVKGDESLEYAGGDNDPFVWKSTTEQVTIRAWSYGTSTNLSYTLTAPETFDYNLETDQQNNGYRELLYCKADNKSYSGGAISLNFYHQLTRLVINVKHELEDALAVTSVSIGGTFPVSARFSVPTGSDNVGSWDVKSTQAPITPKTETTQSGAQRTYSAVLFPKNYAKNSRVFTLVNSDGNYVYNIGEDEGQTLVAGNQYNYIITVKNGFSQNFSYVASAQTFTAPQTGTYKIECWGASGGNAVEGKGSCGGYVSGIISLDKGKELYVYTGQKGNVQNNSALSNYMFNGGGYAEDTNGGKCGACGGGGTDVRTINGNWDNASSLNSRIIVAGGGGGFGGNYGGPTPNGSAGGLDGYKGYEYNKGNVVSSEYQGYGGTQSGGGQAPVQWNPSNPSGGGTTTNGTAGAFGKGGTGGHSLTNTPGGGGSGGGGGFYGGSGASGLASGSWSGGGGSSYISGHPGCTAKSLTFKDNTTVMIDGAGYKWTSTKGSYVGVPTIADANTTTAGYVGDGYCRITRYGY